MDEPIEFEAGSGNVYADLGFPNAEGMLRKAQLTHEIGKIIKRPDAGASNRPPR